jgi:hypothetical protein
MSALYRIIHGDNDPEMALLYRKTKGRKQQYLRSLYLQGVVSKDTYEELMDIIHMASLDELALVDLPKMKHDKDIIQQLRAIIMEKQVPRRKVWSAGLRVKLPDSLDHLSGNEKQERNSWITKTKRLYDRLIRIQACTAKDKEDFEANIHSIQSPIDAERIYLNLYLRHHDKYQTVMNSTYCSKCQHCTELKNLMQEAFDADVEEFEQREREE